MDMFKAVKAQQSNGSEDGTDKVRKGAKAKGNNDKENEPSTKSMQRNATAVVEEKDIETQIADTHIAATQFAETQFAVEDEPEDGRTEEHEDPNATEKGAVEEELKMET